MAYLPQPFVASSLGPLADGTGSIPPGLQPLEIIGHEIVPNADGKPGIHLKLHLKVFEGPNAGATGADRFNLDNPNETAQKIAWETFGKLLHCIGLGHVPVHNLDVLTGKKVAADVQLQAEPNPKKYTEIRGYQTLSGDKPYRADGGVGAGVKPSQAAPVAAPAAPAAASPGGWPAAAAPAAAAPVAAAPVAAAPVGAAPAGWGAAAGAAPAAAGAPAGWGRQG